VAGGAGPATHPVSPTVAALWQYGGEDVYQSAIVWCNTILQSIRHVDIRQMAQLSRQANRRFVSR
jgi:hypothetical protein